MGRVPAGAGPRSDQFVDETRIVPDEAVRWYDELDKRWCFGRVLKYRPTPNMITRVPPNRVWRSFLLLLGLVLAYAGNAQKTPELDYALQFSFGITVSQEKFLQEGLLDQDPSAELWVDRPTNSALLRIHGPLDREALQAHVSTSGLAISSCQQILTAQPDVLIGQGGTQDEQPHDQAPE